MQALVFNIHLFDLYNTGLVLAEVVAAKLVYDVVVAYVNKYLPKKGRGK